MAAALVALSSTSAFAEKDSFVVGIAGEYFIPLGQSEKIAPTGRTDLAKENNPAAFVATDAVENANRNKSFFVSPYIGYNITDTISLGATVMWNPMGFEYQYQPVKTVFDNTVSAEFRALHGNAGRNPAEQSRYNELVAKFTATYDLTETFKPITGLVTADVKLFENDLLSFRGSLGVGSTYWRHEYKFEKSTQHPSASTVDHNKDPSGLQNASTLTFAGKALVAANFNLMDVATLSVSAGYVYLGNPEQFKHEEEAASGAVAGAAKTKKEIKIDDKFKAHGFVVGLGISKEF